MEGESKIVDGFKFMPPSLKAWISQSIPAEDFSGPIPWTPIEKPLAKTTIALMTSAGISMKSDPPFDMDRERREPTWGDPSYREIHRDATGMHVDVNHLHIKTDYIQEDINVMLPLQRFIEFEDEGTIGRLAPTSYSFYGFQLDPRVLLEETVPKVASRMSEEGVEAVFLTPA
jgi:D-proline reductase (dithiol) PrdB